MNGFDRQSLYGALALVVMARVVTSGAAPAARWRRALRLAAILGFVVALAMALAETVFWWAGSGR